MTSCAFAASVVPLLGSSSQKEPNQGAQADSQKSRAEEAISLMRKYGSCCSGVLAAYASELGMEEELAAGLGRGMAGGVGSLGNVDLIL